tara:strand:+ start:248 stop:505 length:258 start_codon:yes stop_codon:yes gene_type:complete
MFTEGGHDKAAHEKSTRAQLCCSSSSSSSRRRQHGPVTMSGVLFFEPEELFLESVTGQTVFHVSEILGWEERGPPTLQAFFVVNL